VELGEAYGFPLAFSLEGVEKVHISGGEVDPGELEGDGIDLFHPGELFLILFLRFMLVLVEGFSIVFELLVCFDAFREHGVIEEAA